MNTIRNLTHEIFYNTWQIVLEDKCLQITLQNDLQGISGIKYFVTFMPLDLYNFTIAWSSFCPNWVATTLCTKLLVFHSMKEIQTAMWVDGFFFLLSFFMETTTLGFKKIIFLQYTSALDSVLFNSIYKFKNINAFNMKGFTAAVFSLHIKHCHIYIIVYICHLLCHRVK